VVGTVMSSTRPPTSIPPSVAPPSVAPPSSALPSSTPPSGNASVRPPSVRPPSLIPPSIRVPSVPPSSRPPPGRAIEEPYFALPDTLPFKPGAGPFRVKGWGYLGDTRFYDEHVPGGARAVAQAVKDPAITAFVNRPIEPNSWYDIYPKLYLGHAAARLRGATYEAHSREVSRWHAQDKFSGIYRPLLKMVSSELLAMWIPRMSSSFYDFGSTETRVRATKVVSVIRYGVPRIVVRWWAYAATAYFEYVLLTGGARHPHVRWLPVEPDGERLGVDLHRMTFEITWA